VRGCWSISEYPTFPYQLKLLGSTGWCIQLNREDAEEHPDDEHASYQKIKRQTLHERTSHIVGLPDFD
jgi:hypothetical protein